MAEDAEFNTAKGQKVVGRKRPYCQNVIEFAILNLGEKSVMPVT